METIRPLQKQDFPLINQAIVEQRWSRFEKLWTALIDPHEVRHACFGQNPNIQAVILYDTYLFLYQVVTPWYSKKPILQECLLFLINKIQKCNFSDVKKAIEQIGIQHQCYMVSVGTAMADDRIYGRLLERVGFTPQLRGYALMLPQPT